MPEEHVFKLEDEEIYSCPGHLMDKEAISAMDDWDWMQRGFLPRAGGVDDQYEKDLEIIELIDCMYMKTRKKSG